MPTDPVYLRSLRIEPLDPKKHDRTAFESGIARVDNFLKRTAKKQQADDHTRVQVAVSTDAVVVGYYALNAHQIELPETGRHGANPAAYLSMLGVSSTFQGQGVGQLLMADAFLRVLNAGHQIGLAALILDVIHDDGEAAARRRQTFYHRLGFQSFPSQPQRMFITLDTLRRAAAQ